MEKKRFLIILGVVFLCCFNGTCDQTVLTGKIVTEKNTLKINETIPLRLEVPQDLDEIYRIGWIVDPSDAGIIRYKEYSVYLDRNQYGKEDRVAQFTALKEGKCTIRTLGFYRQTNPQPIASIDLVIE